MLENLLIGGLGFFVGCFVMVWFSNYLRKTSPRTEFKSKVLEAHRVKVIAEFHAIKFEVAIGIEQPKVVNIDDIPYEFYPDKVRCQIPGGMNIVFED